MFMPPSLPYGYLRPLHSAAAWSDDVEEEGRDCREILYPLSMHGKSDCTFPIAKFSSPHDKSKHFLDLLLLVSIHAGTRDTDIEKPGGVSHLQLWCNHAKVQISRGGSPSVMAL